MNGSSPSLRQRTSSQERMLGFYRCHTAVSDPGPFTDVFSALPAEVPDLVEMIGGVFTHYEFDLVGTGFRPSPERLADVDVRSVTRILARIFDLDPRPLTEARPMTRRFLGVCRDASLLMCAALRSHGVPARLRYGLAHHLYLPTRPMHDHVVVEYWDTAAERWRYADGRMYESVRRAHGLPAHLRDEVPPELFLTGGQAWLRARDSDHEAFKMSGFMLDADAGRWLTRNLLMYDLASVNGCEPLMWDAWGYIRRSRQRARPRGPLQHRRMDRLACLDTRDPAGWETLMRTYQRLRLIRVPGRVLSCSPVNGRQIVSLTPASGVRCVGH